MAIKTKTPCCGACCNLDLIPENATHRLGGYRVGYCWGGPVPWRATTERVSGCDRRGVLWPRWSPERQWHMPKEKT